MLTLLERITADPVNDDIDALVDLVALIRPSSPAQGKLAAANVRMLVQLLKGNPAHAAALRHYLLHVLSIRRHTTVYTDIGILPSYGFFSELFRRLSYRILPPAIDKLYLSDCLDRILSVDTDYQWLQAIDARDWQALLDVIASGATHLRTGEALRTDQAAHRLANMELLEAIQTLSHRISAMGLEPDLVRIHPDLEKFESPFLVQNVEAHRFLDSALRRRDAADARATTAAPPENEATTPPVDADHLLVMLDQCDSVIARIRKKSLLLGTTVALTYLLVRLTQNIERLRRLLLLVDVTPSAVAQPWTEVRRQQTLELAMDLAKAHNRKYAIRELFTANINLLARNVTENASHTGEHYIAENRREYGAMFRSSAGAGFIIGFMAMLKILASYLRAAPLVEAFLFSLNYSLGFMLIHLLHFTVATKQPAMTAARIATDLQTPDSRNINIESLADLIVKVLRTQFVAVFGNLVTAFPTALAIASVWISIKGHHLVSPDKARHMLADIDPLSSLAIFYAAIAGVCLFLAGMISGYFDNRAVYTKMAQRVLRLHGLRRLFGERRHARIAHYIEKNLGGLMGNLFFGILLGTIGTFGQLVGLPLDIRHITFSATNLAIAWVGLDFLVSWQTMLTSVVGILCIGIANLLVSFGLALFVALRSRQVRFTKGWTLVRALLSRLVHRPLDFFIAPKIGVKPE
ncbi:site-specific recombinase [Actimicrobium antarcticum]|uniref:Site-specific recombinase n=1 Tax=Actimicrobium antarcticum TaxID=1051899 RepID=A0ABP7SGN8_9BURK